MFVCPLRFYPATSRWGVRRGCVCFGSGCGCAPPLLAGVLGCACLCARSACTPPLLAGMCGVGVCVWARVVAAPRLSWLGCWGVCVCVPALLVPCHSWLGCAVWVCVLGLGFWLRPSTPGWDVGVCVCLCACSACTPPLLAGTCVVGVSVRARVSAAPRHSWLGCRAVCLLLCALRLYPATPGWGVRCGRVPLGLSFGCAPPLLPGLLGCACLCARSACAPAFLAGLCGVGVCAWARVLADPPLSCLGCWGVCVFVCVLRLYPATPRWGVWRGCVRLGSGLGCAPPLLAGVSGFVCACVCSALVPCNSWPECAVWVCVLRLGFRLRPATPGWGVGVCVCLPARSACTPPLLARVCCVDVCVWARASAAPRHSWLEFRGVRVCLRAPLVPRHSWLGCAVWLWVRGLRFRLPQPLLAGRLGCVCVCFCALLVPHHSWLGCVVLACVFKLGFRLRPATPGWGLRCGYGCVGFGLGCPSRSWLGCWGVCVFVSALCLYPTTLGWGVWCWRLCLGSGFGCAPPLLAGVLGCVCICVRAPLVPRHSWLGRAAWVCVFGLGFRLRPATPSWGVGVCLPLCARFACTPPFLAGVCGVLVWCCLAPVLVPSFVACCATCPGWRHLVAVVAWHLSVCLGCGRRRASLACLVAPRGAPRLVRSSRSRCSPRRSRRPGAFPQPGGLRPWLYSVAARGTRRPAKNRAHCACCWPPPRQGHWARSPSYPFGAPRWGCLWRVPPASILSCMRCGGWRVCTRSLTRRVSRTVRLSTGDSAGAPGLFRVDADAAPLGSVDATPGSRACLRVGALLCRVGWAGLPGALWCASPFPFVWRLMRQPEIKEAVLRGAVPLQLYRGIADQAPEPRATIRHMQLAAINRADAQLQHGVQVYTQEAQQTSHDGRTYYHLLIQYQHAQPSN